MEDQLRAAVEQVISRATGRPATIAARHDLGGGCIHRAQTIRLADGRRYVVKSSDKPLPGVFEREAEGLAALQAIGALRVPRPIGSGGGADGCAAFLVIEHIATGQRRGDFFERFGRAFAELHLGGQSARFGFASDNYLGSTVQPNGWLDDWVEFWRDRRLGFQLALARRNRLTDRTMEQLAERLLQRLPELIAQPDEPACLLHGDLWGGNYIVDEAGRPTILDPAAYYGRREADLAMTRLFGGFDPAFYAAYEEVWPLAAGAEERLPIYELYHLLNHLNLFGSSYRESCMSILRRFGGG